MPNALKKTHVRTELDTAIGALYRVIDGYKAIGVNPPTPIWESYQQLREYARSLRNAKTEEMGK